jgi:hypothetical protein
MKLRTRLTAALMAGFLALIAPLQVYASATITSFVGTCGSIAVSGTTTAPYIVLYVYNYTNSTQPLFAAYPVTGGAFSHAVTFASAGKGSQINYEVWGSPDSNPNDWDHEAYFNVTQSCSGDASPVPALGPIGVALLALMLAGATALVNSRRIRLPLRRR